MKDIAVGPRLSVWRPSTAHRPHLTDLHERWERECRKSRGQAPSAKPLGRWRFACPRGYSALYVPWRIRSTTANAAEKGETFRVTHPYHPLFGREYKLVTYCHGWGSHRVYFHDDAGRLRKIPACWTNVVADDPFVVVAAGRSAFRVADLLLLADVIEVLQPRRRDQQPAKVSRVFRR